MNDISVFTKTFVINQHKYSIIVSGLPYAKSNTFFHELTRVEQRRSILANDESINAEDLNKNVSGWEE